MDLYQIISYPLYAGGVLEVILGIALLKRASRQGRTMLAGATLFFASAAFVLVTALSYTLESLGRDFNVFNRAGWIGWFMIPACLQLVYYLQDEESRKARIVGYVLYPFWSVVFAVTMLTDLVEPGDASLIPFIDVDGPLEDPLRFIGTVMAIWLIVEVYRAKQRTTGLKRAQLNLFFYGTLFYNAGCILIAGVLPLFGAINPAFTTFFSLPWVILTYYAITRHRLFDLRVLVSRVLNITLLSFLFAFFHIAIFKLLTPALGDTIAILFSLSVIGLAMFGTQFSNNVQHWIQRVVLRGRYDYQGVLRECSRAISTILDMNVLQNHIMTNLKTGLEVDRVVFVLRGPTGYVIQQTGDAGRPDAGPGNFENYEVIEWLQQTRQVIVLDELERTDDRSIRIRAYMAAAGAELILPLIFQDQIKGFILLGQKGSGEPYLQSDITILESLADHAAIALENARLYDVVKQAKESLQESERKFRTLAETAATAIFIHQGGRFLYVNRAAEAIGGYAIEEYLAMNFMSLVHPDYVDLVKQRASERLGGAGGVPQQYEFQIVHKNGTALWVLMTAGITEFEGKSTVIGTLIDISARKQAEEDRERLYRYNERQYREYIAEQERFKAIINVAHDGFWINDGTTNFEYVNDAYCRMTGYSRDELMQMRISDVETLEEPDMIAQHTKWIMEAGHDVFETRHRRKDGSLIDLEATVTFYEQERVFFSFFRDITARKKAEEERSLLDRKLREALKSLKESEAKFRSLAETAPASIFIHRGGNFLYANQASSVMMGYTREEFLNMDFWGVTHPDDKATIIARGRGRLSGDQPPQRYELRIITKNNEVRWLDMTVTVIEYEGKPAVLGTAFDVTDRKHAEEALAESEERYRRLVEFSPEPIMVHSAGNIAFANPACATLLGYQSAGDLVGKKILEHIHTDDRERAAENIRQAQDDITPTPLTEYTLLKKDGTLINSEVTGLAINYLGKKARLIVIRDITDRKRAEEEKTRLYEQRIAVEKRHLQEKEKLLMDLHDGIGGITTNISIISELAQKSADLDSIKKTLTTISRLSQEGVTEIRSFMHSLDSQELNWRTLATEMKSQGSNLVEPHNVGFTFTSTVAEIQEQPGSMLWVNLFRIYKESLTNVIKHSAADSVAVALSIDERALELTIQDNGIGWKKISSNGRGLRNIQKRAAEIGGQAAISGESGTRVSVTIPLPLKYPDTGME